jgi:DNA primase
MRRRLLSLHQQAAEWYHHNLMNTAAAKSARDYLKGRELTGEVAKAWKIGYAPDSWDALGDWAHAQGFTNEEIRQSGLVASRDEGNSDGDFYDRFRDRVMFPICNAEGEVIGFSGRVLQPDAKTAKYVNSPETMLFIKGNVLFGLHKSKRPLIDKGFAIVCEGQIDLISAFEAGVQNVIAPQGTAFTEKQTRILKRYVEEVVLCFDSDNAGQNAADKSLPSLLGENLTVRVVELPAGEDPDSLIRNKGVAAFSELVTNAKDFFDYQIARAAASPDFANARGKMQFARKMAAWISLITDTTLREAVSSKVAMRMEISREEFMKLLQQPKQQGKPATPAEKTEGSTIDLSQLDPVITNLIHVALINAEARAWLTQQDWESFLSGEPNMELLVKVLAQEITPGDNTAINSWLATLPGDEEWAIRRILEKGILPISQPSKNDAVSKRPEEASGISWHPLKTAQDAWVALRRRQDNRQLEAIYARLRQPGLSAEEATVLQKQILDLQKRNT